RIAQARLPRREANRAREPVRRRGVPPRLPGDRAGHLRLGAVRGCRARRRGVAAPAAAALSRPGGAALHVGIGGHPAAPRAGQREEPLRVASAGVELGAARPAAHAADGGAVAQRRRGGRPLRRAGQRAGARLAARRRGRAWAGRAARIRQRWARPRGPGLRRGGRRDRRRRAGRLRGPPARARRPGAGVDRQRLHLPRRRHSGEPERRPPQLRRAARRVGPCADRARGPATARRGGPAPGGARASRPRPERGRGQPGRPDDPRRTITAHLSTDVSTLPDLLLRRAGELPDAPFLRHANARWTYGEFGHRVTQVAAGLREAGVGKGDVVGVILRNGPEYLEVWWGILWLGAVFNPVNPDLTGRE